MAYIHKTLKSRKLWYGVSTSIAIFTAGIMAAKWPSFGVQLSTVVGGLIGVYAVYNGTNVSQKWVQGPPVIQNNPSQPIEPIPDESNTQ